MRYLLCFVCLACATPCFGQDLLNRVAQLEALTAQQAKRLDTIEDRLAKIEAGLSGKVTKAESPISTPKACTCCPSCGCGCNKGGGCDCGGPHAEVSSVPVGSIGHGSDGLTYIKTLSGWQPLSSAPASLPVGGYSSLPAFGGGGGCANGSCSGGRRR